MKWVFMGRFASSCLEFENRAFHAMSAAVRAKRQGDVQGAVDEFEEIEIRVVVPRVLPNSAELLIASPRARFGDEGVGVVVPIGLYESARYEVTLPRIEIDRQ